mgnify:CR=1 FL=1
MVMMPIDDEDRHGGIVKIVESMMVREIDMNMLRIIEKHREALRGGGWCLEWLHPPPKGFNVKGEREREEER